MPIPRSKSAPQPISFSYGGQNQSYTNPSKGKGPIRSQSSSSLVPVHSLYHSRNIEREDPFNLSTFFPSQLGGQDKRENEWHWLREDVRNASLYGDTDEEDVDDVFSTPSGIMLGDDIASQSINGEDKLGVLSLCTFLPKCDYRDRRADIALQTIRLRLREILGPFKTTVCFHLTHRRTQ